MTNRKQHGKETSISLANQRQQGASHALKDVLPLRICASHCAPRQPLLRAFFRMDPIFTSYQRGKHDVQGYLALRNCPPTRTTIDP